MIKKFLSFVALSATLISPVFADEFVPLQYYEDEPVHYIPQTKIATPTRINSSILSTRSADNSWGSDSKWESDECAIRQAIEDNDTHEVEDYKNSSSSKIDDKTIDDILSVMRSGNTWRALEIFDSEVIGSTCGGFSSSYDTNNRDEYYAGPGGRRGRDSMEDLENAARTDRKSRELLDEIGSFKNGNSISQSAKDAKKLSDSAAKKLAKDKGFENSHDLKKAYIKKSESISKYNIYLNKKTGEAFLIDSRGSIIPIY